MDVSFRVFAEDRAEIDARLAGSGLAGVDVQFDCCDARVQMTGAQQDCDALCELFSDITYEYAGARSLAEVLVDELRSRGLQISVAESCTGGLVCAALIAIPGASDVFYEGVVSYHNNAKMDRLGVEEDTLARYGAVSEETAIEMAGGLLNDVVSIGVSTTGIAGPGGGSDEKPVGLVFVAVATDDEDEVFEHHFSGDRNEVRRSATNAALYHALQHIRNYF